jgi:hypothetical protein
MGKKVVTGISLLPPVNHRLPHSEETAETGLARPSRISRLLFPPTRFMQTPPSPQILPSAGHEEAHDQHQAD